ncbi:MAG: hydrogenase maturation protease [Polyangiaceae bacterium]|nr:hydrogenase maturation protease [Polyangiaceae bacterium]MBK8937257.1 hydrogenase maturation protease [Polyangiaceae bacterium]
MSPTIVCLGEPFAGDDGVGAVVAEHLRAAGGSPIVLADPLELLELVTRGRPLVIVDAVVTSSEPGQVLCLEPLDLAPDRQPISSHRAGVAGVLELAATLGPVPPIEIVAITIRPPQRLGLGLTPAVARAAVEASRAICERYGATPRPLGADADSASASGSLGPARRV